MRMSDVVLFSPPIVLAALGWIVALLSRRSARRFHAELDRKAAAE